MYSFNYLLTICSQHDIKNNLKFILTNSSASEIFSVISYMINNSFFRNITYFYSHPFLSERFSKIELKLLNKGIIKHVFLYLSCKPHCHSFRKNENFSILTIPFEAKMTVYTSFFMSLSSFKSF